MPDEEWTLFIRKHDSASEGYSPKLYIGKVAKYIYSAFQSGASISNVSGQFVVKHCKHVIDITPRLSKYSSFNIIIHDLWITF